MTQTQVDLETLWNLLVQADIIHADDWLELDPWVRMRFEEAVAKSCEDPLG